MANILRVSHRGGPGGYMGVIKEGKRVVWECGHWHHNRNQSTYTNGESATACAGLMMALVRDPAYLNTMRKWAMNYGRSPRDYQAVKILEAYAPVADLIRARPSGCQCTAVCDCANPEPYGDGVAHCSNECPVHNLRPLPNPECPVHQP
jgi:hypothetical protein